MGGVCDRTDGSDEGFLPLDLPFTARASVVTVAATTRVLRLLASA
jgi:hypothetical protein